MLLSMQLDTRRFRPHQVLGDAQHYQAMLQQRERFEAQRKNLVPAESDKKAAQESLSDMHQMSIPRDVWAAAQLLGDKGMHLVQVYRELAAHRKAAIQQITLNQTRHAPEQQHQKICAHTTVPNSSSSSQQQSSRQAMSLRSTAAATCRTAGACPASLDAAGLANRSNPARWQDKTALPRSNATERSVRHASAAPGQLLSKRTVMDTIVESHDERVLARWRAQETTWQAQAAVLVARTGKKPEDLTLARGDEWRQKLELLAKLEVAVPAAAAARHKVNITQIINSEGDCNSSDSNADGNSGLEGSINDGDAAGTTAAAGGHWMATLRNANERFVVIGNIFSGLFLSLHNRNTVAAAGMATIRRPTALSASTASATATATGAIDSTTAHHSTLDSTLSSTLHKTTKSSTAPRRGSWMDAPYLKQKLAAGAAAVAALAPAGPEPETLMVTGTSLDCGELAAALALRPVALVDVEKRLAVADPALFRQYQAAQQAAAAKAAAAAAEEAEQARRAAIRAAAAAYPHPGPHLEADVDYLSLHYTIPSAAASHMNASSSSNSQPVLVDGQGEVITASGGVSCIAGADGSTGCGAGAATAVLTVSNTGTAAVYYKWTCTGRPRALQAASSCAAAADGQQQECEETPEGFRQWMPEAPERCTFYLPNQQGVILPGEKEQFRFSFKSTSPGIYHETWAMTTHPPLQPNPNAPFGSEASRKGHPMHVAIKGVAVTEVAAGASSRNSAVGLVQRQKQLEGRLAMQCREGQVQAALALLLDNLAEQIAQRQQVVTTAAVAPKQHNSRSRSGCCVGSGDTTPAEAAAAAKWAAANPPVCVASSGSSDTKCVTIAAADGAIITIEGKSIEQYYYYHPEVEAKLCDIYSKAVLLLQPPLPPPEPKKGVKAFAIGSSHSNATNSSSTANSTDPAAEHSPLPETWDSSVSGLRAVLALLSGLPQHKQSGAVLTQQAEIALQTAAVPRSRRDMVAAACRHMLTHLADTIPTAAAAARAAARHTSGAGGVASAQNTHRGKNCVGLGITEEHSRSTSSSGTSDNIATAAHTSSNSAADTGTGTIVAAAPVAHPASSSGQGSASGIGGGATTHRTKAAAVLAAAGAAGPPINHEQYHLLFTNNVWSAMRQQFGVFELVLGQYQKAAAARLDAAAAQAAAAATALAATADTTDAMRAAILQDKRERIAWAQFVPMRRKHELGLP